MVKNKYRRSPYDWERNSLLALGSMYGVDLLADNCVECRKRLYDIWNKEYKAVCKKECNEDTRSTAKHILERNIVCGNALTLKRVDDEGEDIDDPIVFSEWVFPFNDTRMQRSDYTFAELLAEREEPTTKTTTKEQIGMFESSDVEHEVSEEGVFQQKTIKHYRRIHEND